MASPYISQGVNPVATAAGGQQQQQAPPSMQKWYEQPTPHKNGTEELRSVTPAMNNTRGAFRSSSNGGQQPPPPGSHGDVSPYRQIGHGMGGGPTAANVAHTPVTSGGGAPPAPFGHERSSTPNRYLGAYNSPGGDQASGIGGVSAGGGGSGGSGGPTGAPGSASKQSNESHTPSSTGLIRLSLRKPMGIVFEPMYDPNNPSTQRGVRICDLPRTGAAALSRKLEVGDELLSINDKTMSRLTFDEIMDFIIEADPEEVNLLFRRPRKEILQARQGIKKPINQTTAAAVKWVDDDVRNKKKDGTAGSATNTKTKKDRSGKPDKSKSSSRKKEEEDTITSADDDYRGKSRKKTKSRKLPYESESFLDLLIDTICANPDLACRERRRNDDDYYSDEDEEGTFASQDDSTYVTYESEEQVKRRGRDGKGHDKHHDDHKHASSKKRDDSSVDEETEEDTVEDKWKRRRSREKEQPRNKSPSKQPKRAKTPENQHQPVQHEGKYEDDGTLETVESAERQPPAIVQPEDPPPPLGLTPDVPEPINLVMPPPSDTDEDAIPAPIKEVEYDERVDHGADVSVMESLGGPSLLIEKQRQVTKAQSPTAPPVPSEIIENFGQDYPVTFGLTHEQTIQNDPLKFYTHVVKALLEEHEPEKVRLLDKLLAKYKGREDHLVQKLSVRYNKPNEEPQQNPIQTTSVQDEEEVEERAFNETMAKNHESTIPNLNVDTSRPKIHNTSNDQGAEFHTDEWPEKETKEAEEGDSAADEQTNSGSEYSAESIDGTSPAVIAQVSELLNYVYGKTSVPGQIDRVSTIMRAYEGREAVLLELLETKALIKANKEKENTDNLPSFLRNSQAMQYMSQEVVATSGTGVSTGGVDMPPVTPMATQQHGGSGTVINDDISSMSGVSSPSPGDANAQQQNLLHPVGGAINPVSDDDDGLGHQNYGHGSDGKDPGGHDGGVESGHTRNNKARHAHAAATSSAALTSSDKKKKKGLFGGLFGGKKGKNKQKQDITTPIYGASESLRSGSRSRSSTKRLKNARSAEVSI